MLQIAGENEFYGPPPRSENSHMLGILKQMSYLTNNFIIFDLFQYQTR